MAMFRTLDQGPGGDDSPGSGLPPGITPPPPYTPPPRPPTTDNPYWPNEPPPGAPPSSGNTPGTPPSGGPTPPSGGSGPAIGTPDWIAQWLKENAAKTGVNPSVGTDPAYWTRRIAETGGLTDANRAYWEHLMMRPEGAPENWQSGGPGQSGYGSYGTNTFSDPATQQWEQLLNSMVNRLNTPYTPAGFQPMIDQLTHYFQQLQGPAYTPAQMDLIQTQSTDPLMRNRDAARQQILEQFSRRGLTPDSPLVQSALEQSDRQYGIANTQNQSQFATNAIGLDRQNAATAAQIGPQIAGLQQGLYNYNLGNQLQGVNLANQIPTTAWNRLTGANQLINPLNPSQLFGDQYQFGQQGFNQSNAFMQYLMQILSQLFR